jgi:hypothetical protein
VHKKVFLSRNLDKTRFSVSQEKFTKQSLIVSIACRLEASQGKRLVACFAD